MHKERKMTKLLPILIFMTCGTPAISQELKRPNSTYQETKPLQFKKYHLVYPREALDAEIEGTITVTFDVDSACYLTNRRQDIILGYGCDEAVEEALDRFEKDYRKENRYRCDPRNNYKIPIEFEIPRK